MYRLQDASVCTQIGKFPSAQQCAAAAVTNSNIRAVRFSSANGDCSGCTSSFSQSAAIKHDQPYDFYACNLPQGTQTQMPASLAAPKASGWREVGCGLKCRSDKTRRHAEHHHLHRPWRCPRRCPWRRLDARGLTVERVVRSLRRDERKASRHHLRRTAEPLRCRLRLRCWFACKDRHRYSAFTQRVRCSKAY